MKTLLIKVLTLILVIKTLTFCERERSNPLQNESVIMDVDVSAKFMRENGGLPVGDDCEKINYYVRGGGLQDLTMVAKFICPQNKADSIVESLVKWNDRQIGKIGDRVELSNSPYGLNMLPKEELSKIKWWDLESVKISKASISKEGFGCSFWITEPLGDQVTIYVCQKS